MMISAGENLGWVQKLMGHAYLKMSSDNKFDCINKNSKQVFFMHDKAEFVSEIFSKGKIIYKEGQPYI
jgi:hypothetical protein